MTSSTVFGGIAWYVARTVRATFLPGMMATVFGRVSLDMGGTILGDAPGRSKGVASPPRRRPRLGHERGAHEAEGHDLDAQRPAVRHPAIRRDERAPDGDLEPRPAPPREGVAPEGEPDRARLPRSAADGPHG